MVDEVIIPRVPSEKKRNRELVENNDLSELSAFANRAKGIELKQEKLEAKRETYEYDDGHKTPFHITHRIIRATSLVALLAWFIIVILLSMLTSDNPFAVLVGLSPIMLTIIVTYVLVDKYHLESGFLLVFPFIFTGILLLLGVAGLLEGMDYLTLGVVNIIFGLVFEIVITTHYSILKNRGLGSLKSKEEMMSEVKQLVINLDDEEGLKKFVSSIEDKAKAINAVIGRVYSVRRGGNEQLRKKIRIDSEHYNEFNELKDRPKHERKQAAIRLVKKIKDSLDDLDHPEKIVFDKDILKNLVNLERDAKGEDKIIDVLVKNDKDPIKAYYDGAIEFCNDAIKELRKE